VIRRGFYRHYKGDIYFVEGVGQIDNEGPRLVAYQSVRGVEADAMQFRWESEFEEWVDPSDNGSVAAAWVDEISDKAIAAGVVRRFTRIEP
jgi:hypothetical protein